jgi:hypothetical protein
VASAIVVVSAAYYAWAARIPDVVDFESPRPTGFMFRWMLARGFNGIQELLYGAIGAIAPVLVGIWLARFRPLEQPAAYAARLRRVAVVGIAGGLVLAVAYYLARFGVLDVPPLSLTYVEGLGYRR